MDPSPTIGKWLNTLNRILHTQNCAFKRIFLAHIIVSEKKRNKNFIYNMIILWENIKANRKKD